MNRILKDAIFGVAGGIAGTFVIGQVMGALSKTKSEEEKQREKRMVPEAPPEKLARKVSEEVAGVELDHDTKSTLGQAVHWSYGALWGGVYGVLRRRVPELSWGVGLPFGVALGIFGPEVMLPLMGLTPGPTAYPPAEHARGLTAHYAYAATVEGVCQLGELAERRLAGRRTNPDLRRAS